MTAPTAPAARPETVAAVRAEPPPATGRVAPAAWVAGALVTLLYVLILRDVAPGLVADEPAAGLDFLPVTEGFVTPEPLEQLRYVLACTAPLAMAGTAWAAARLLRPLDAAWTPALLVLALAVQAGGLLLVGWAWLRQRDIWLYFSAWQGLLAVVVALAVVALVVGPRRPAPRALRRVARRLPARLPSALAALATLATVSFAVFRDGNVVDTLPINVGHWPVFTEEIVSAAGGRTPLVDFVPQYTSVLPYLGIPLIALISPSLLVVSGLLAALSGVALHAVHTAFRALTGRAWWALGLYLAFLSVAMQPNGRDGPHLHALVNYWGVMPMRYIGPFVTLAVLAWTLSAPTPRRHALLGVAAGLSLLNNVEFGLPTLLAAVLAVACAGAPSRTPALRERAADLLWLGAGAAAAVVGFVLLTVVRSGELPDVVNLVAFARQFAAAGFYMVALPGALGLHALIFATFVACVVVALVQALTGTARPGAAGRVAVGLLAFSGVFGLGALSYYIGRSLPMVLLAIFAAWSIALTVLTWETVVRLRAARSGTPTQTLLLLPALVLVGHLALTATTLHDDRGVLGQPGRLLDSGGERIYEQRPMTRMVAECTRPGEATMLLYPLGYRIALSAGVENWMPYNHPDSIVTVQQVDRVEEVIRERGVSVVYAGDVVPALSARLAGMGFRASRQRPDYSRTVRPGLNTSRILRAWRRADAPPPASCAPGTA